MCAEAVLFLEAVHLVETEITNEASLAGEQDSAGLRCLIVKLKCRPQGAVCACVFM